MENRNCSDQPAIIDLPIRSLGLSVKSRKALGSLGINSISDLINNARIIGIGKNEQDSYDEINGAFRAWAGAITGIDWAIYRSFFTRETRYPVLPRREAVVWSAIEFLQEFPNLVTEVVRLQFGLRHAFVVRERTLRSRSERWTLERVAAELGVTRERVSAIEKRIILVLQRSLLEDDYRRLHFRLRRAFTEPLQQLQSALKEYEFQGTIGSRPWADTVRRVWAVDVRDIADTEPLILEILQLRISGQDLPAENQTSGGS